MTFGENLVLALMNYWKIAFLIIFPLALLPIFLVQDDTSNRCIYVITLMGGFWLLEILPIAITSLIPVAIFPVLSILPTKKTSSCYITEPTALFVGSYLLALAVQECNLHMRITLNILKVIGFSPKKLHLLFTCITLFMSIWISSIPSTALMIPIVYATLTELESRDICKIYKEGSFSEDEQDIYEDKRRPTKFAIGFLMSIAYASMIGGTGYFTGDSSNVEFKKIYESSTSKQINSGMWFVLSIPYMIISICLTIFWIQIFYMGLFRPNSSDSQDLRDIPDEEKASSNDYIIEKLETMGRITFHEIAVSICVIVAMLLWFFREPIFMPGWMNHLSMKPASVAMAMIMIIFLVPRLPVCWYACSSDENKIPIENSPGLLLWKFVVRKIPWVLFFLIGGAEAIAEGANASKLSENIKNGIQRFKFYTDFRMYSLLPLITIAMTQLTHNFAICRIVMPTIAELSKFTGIHPNYIMLPTFFGTSFGYLLPVSSPPIAMVADLIHMTSLEIVKTGIVVLIISYLVLLALSSFVLITD